MLPYTWEDFDRGAKWLVRHLAPHRENFRAVYGIPRGGLVLAVYLSHALNVPLLLPGVVPGSDVLVVDDNVVTGHSLLPYMARGCFTAALVCNPYTGINAARESHFFCPDSSDQWPIFPWEPREYQNR